MESIDIRESEVRLEDRYVTVVTTSDSCGKRARLNDGKIAFESSSTLIEGIAETLLIETAEQLAGLLLGLSNSQYVMPDYVPQLVDKKFTILTKANFIATFCDAEESIIFKKTDIACTMLTSDADVWHKSAWYVFDRDVDSNTPNEYQVPYDEWLTILDDKLVNGVKDAPRVYAPSTKGRVVIEGAKTPAESLNSHTWVLCKSGEHEKLAALRSRVKIKSKLACVDWNVKRKSSKTGKELAGSGLSKTLFDHAIWTPHRQIYSGPPTVYKGLELLPAQVNFVNTGTPLDLIRALPEIDDESITVYEKQVGTEIHRAGNGRLVETDQTSLMPKHILEFVNGDKLTVEEFIRSEQYAFDEKYRTQTVFRQSSSWNGITRKYAHGTVMHHDNGYQRTYWLDKPLWRYVCERYLIQSEKTDASLDMLAKCLGGIKKNIYVAVRKEISALLSMSLSALDDLRKQCKDLQPLQIQRKADRNDFQDYDILRRSESPSISIDKLKSYDEVYNELCANCVYLATDSTSSAVWFEISRSKTGHGGALSLRQQNIKVLIEFFSHRVKITPHGKKNPVEDWVSSTKRKSAIGIEFEPGLPKMANGRINLWSGFAVKPMECEHPERHCALFLDHIRDVIAAGDETVNKYLIDWMALRVQGICNRKPNQPLERMNVAIVMRSIQGTGKGLFEQYFAHLFGNHALVTSKASGLAGTFNFQFANLVLLCADEAFFGGDRKVHDVLKSFMTEPVFDFEQKFKDSVSLSNHVAVLMSSNKDFITPADAGDRRNCVIDVSDCKKGDKEYFKALVAEKNSVGPNALLSYLLKRDISEFDVNDYPRTEALEHQQTQSIMRESATFAWLHDALESGVADLRLDKRDEPNSAVWPKVGNFVIYRSDLADIIQAWAERDRSINSCPQKGTIGKELKKIVGLGPGYTRETVGDKTIISRHKMLKSYSAEKNIEAKNRPAIWIMPDLDTARAVFKQYLEKGS